MLTDGFDGFQQISGGVRFNDVASSARIQGLAHHLRRVMLSDEQDFQPEFLRFC